MNKRIYFILLPLLAILFIFNGWADNSVTSFSDAPEFSYSNTFVKNVVPCQVNLTKDDSHRKKNKIRIKAWDDYSAMDVADPCMPAFKIVYYRKPVFMAYSVHFQSAHLLSRNLRGPPANNS